MLHLTPLSQWATTDDPYAPATLPDEGFVHCSPDEGTALAVANAQPHLADLDEPLVALMIDESRLRPEVRWEATSTPPPRGSPDRTLFPHVYGAINRDAVTEVRHVLRDAGGSYTRFRAQPATAATLGLLPHPEGGWFRQTWASDVWFTPPGYGGQRASATAIYFLVPAGERSVWHTVRSDELWLWHSGGPLALSLGGTGARPDRAPERVILGANIVTGARPQVLVPAGTWQAAQPAGETEVLVSCIVSPGFDFADFQTL